MPPKKKGGKKKKKGNKVENLNPEDVDKKASEELEYLQGQLFVRRELARRVMTEDARMQEKIEENLADMDEFDDECQEVLADMTRQYKTLHQDLTTRVHQLESDLAVTQAELDRTQRELKETKEERDRIDHEKSTEIDRLNERIVALQISSEKLINDSLDKLDEDVLNFDAKWKNLASLVSAESKKSLLDFGVTQLYY